MKALKEKSSLEKLIQTLEENSFIIANFKDFMTQHAQPSPVTIEMIKRLEEWIKEIRSDNQQRNNHILDSLKDIKKTQEETMKKVTVIELSQGKMDTKIKTYFGILSFIAIIFGKSIGDFLNFLFRNINS